jgi:hypothetical protein
MNDRELRRYRGLCDLHGQYGDKLFSTRELRADQDLWDLQAPISAAGDIFGRKPRCAARSRMLLTVAALVVGTRSVDFLLVLIGSAKVIRVLGPPLPTRLLFLLAATVRLTAGLLPLLEPRKGIKPTTTKRTSPPREHSFSSSQPQKEKQTERARKEKK